MSRALGVLDMAICGDPGCLSFLERTTSLYVLDVATMPGRPRIYGWWDFLNDALNDVERHESEAEEDPPRGMTTMTGGGAAGGAVGGGGGRIACVDDENEYYDDIRRRRDGSIGRRRNLDAHVRLLATVTRRVARRSPSSDRKLVITCLANASIGGGGRRMGNGGNDEGGKNDDDVGRALVTNNDELRERDMGRIAAIVFDHAYHRRTRRRTRRRIGEGDDANGSRVDIDVDDECDDDARHHPRHRRSAFSDPIAMEQLCGALATNAISAGSCALRHLVRDWMVPCLDNLPTLPVVIVLYYIGAEASDDGGSESLPSRRLPTGTIESLRQLVSCVFRDALGPILTRSIPRVRGGASSLDDIEYRGNEGGGGDCDAMAVETSDRRIRRAACRDIDYDGDYAGEDDDDEDDGHHRAIATFAMRSLDSWCRANTIGAVKLRGIFARTNINILEVIAGALYSDSKIMLDAVSDLVETLLRNDAADAKISLGMSIVESVMGGNVPAGVADQLLVAQQVTGENEKSRIHVLSELVSAIGAQRFRFAERQANGDTAVCRCLARTAANVLLESQGLMQNGALQPSMNGLLDLLFKAASHPSVYVCGIAVEALAAIVPSNGELSTRLLPHLQGKAILPHHLVEDTSEGLEEYINFRDRVLADALVACYAGCGEFYMESCGSAIEEFVQASPSPQLPYQLEAALFCIVAVPDRASKRSINPTSNLIANVLIDPQRRTIMRALWNEVLATLVEAGRRPAEETTMWIQRRVIAATST